LRNVSRKKSREIRFAEIECRLSMYVTIKKHREIRFNANSVNRVSFIHQLIFFAINEPFWTSRLSVRY